MNGREFFTLARLVKNNINKPKSMKLNKVRISFKINENFTISNNIDYQYKSMINLLYILVDNRSFEIYKIWEITKIKILP